jgi:altronate dehydratase large subunit
MNKQFLGYERPDGSVGIRNYVLILPVQRQVNIVAQKIAEIIPGTKTFIYTGEVGRPGEDRRTIYRTLAGLGLNPNAGSVLVVGSSRDAGYEELKAEKIIDRISASGKRVEVLMLAEEDGFYNALGKGIKLAREMVWEISQTLRSPFDFKHLKIGVKCGMSDSTSAICGNPAVGRLFDALITAGGSAIFSETTEVIGAEHILSKRAKNEVVKQKLLEAVINIEEKAKNTGEDIRATNPIPENIAGGLTTLEEKSLGAIVKSGTSPIEDVIQYAERITNPGLYFMDAWMSSLSLPTGYAASGAQLFLYQMGGQGIPGREFPAPAVSSGVVIPIMYLTGNSNTFVRAEDTIDFNSGTVLEDLESMDDVSERLINWVLKVASGAKTKAETINFDDPIELYLHGPVL